jgi:hypothetical protein
VRGTAFDAQRGKIKLRNYWEDEYLQYWFRSSA